AALPLQDTDVVVDRVVTLDLTAAQAASMFWRNLATWGPDAVADGLVTEADRAALLAALTARDHDHPRGLFTWTHHQTVLRRMRTPRTRSPSSWPARGRWSSTAKSESWAPATSSTPRPTRCTASAPPTPRRSTASASPSASRTPHRSTTPRIEVRAGPRFARD